LLEHAAHDFIINIQEKNFFFDIIYNLLANELRILRVYIEKNLKKKFITSFTSFTAILILFIKKKDEKLRLCVNYRELNEIMIKNRYSFSLIKEVINRLVEIKIYQAWYSSCLQLDTSASKKRMKDDFSYAI
jgi:predicted transport protein